MSAGRCDLLCLDLPQAERLRTALLIGRPPGRAKPQARRADDVRPNRA